MIAGIDKINNFIDSREGVQNQETEKQENPDNTKKTQSLTKSYSVNQNLNLKNKDGISTQTNPNLNDKSTPNYEQNLDIYGDEQLFRQEDSRIIFWNGLLNGIIRKYAEINSVVNKFQEKLKKGAKFKIMYKAIEMGDKASIFHQKCDNLEMSLVIIETIKGVRFGGFTTRPWEGNCVQKIDNETFVFSIDRKKIYDVIVFSIFEFIFLFNFELIYIILLLFNFSFSFSFLVSLLLIYTYYYLLLTLLVLNFSLFCHYYFYLM